MSGAEKIIEVAEIVMERVRQAGHPLDRCVWEVDVLVWNLLNDSVGTSSVDALGVRRKSLHGIPLRVDDRIDGIVLRMVNPNMQE